MLRMYRPPVCVVCMYNTPNGVHCKLLYAVIYTCTILVVIHLYVQGNTNVRVNAITELHLPVYYGCQHTKYMPRVFWSVTTYVLCISMERCIRVDDSVHAWYLFFYKQRRCSTTTGCRCLLVLTVCNIIGVPLPRKVQTATPCAVTYYHCV